MKDFALPPFAVADVTEDEMFTGAKLVELSLDDIRKAMRNAK
jgi:hypothetical protein